MISYILVTFFVLYFFLLFCLFYVLLYFSIFLLGFFMCFTHPCISWLSGPQITISGSASSPLRTIGTSTRQHPNVKLLPASLTRDSIPAETSISSYSKTEVASQLNLYLLQLLAAGLTHRQFYLRRCCLSI